MTQDTKFSRRSVLKGTAAMFGATALGTVSLPGHGHAAAYPARSIRVAIPTDEGGQVDRAARAFTDVWAKHLGASFEFDYYPGASGQVGYEIFIGRFERDGHSLLFGNLGPEMIMYATQNPSYKYPEDFAYFVGLDNDDAVIWVADNSPYKTIEDLVAAGKEKTINISTSRLPHPASLGVLALAEATGAKFKLIPYGGGSATRSAALTGEVDACATFLGSSVKLDDQIRFLTVFNKKNPLPDVTDNAPPVNSVFKSTIPPLTGTRAWAAHRELIEKHPDRFEKLVTTARAAFDDPAYKDALKKAKIPLEFSEWQDMESLQAQAAEVLALAKKYAPMLKGTK